MAGTALAKNIFNPQISEQDLENVVLELEQEEFKMGKREAKNIVDLNFELSDDSLEIQKRDSKNTFGAKLIVDDNHLFKREAKNTFDINLTIDDASIYKRDGKNVFNLDLIITDDNLNKREAEPKNVVNIDLIIDDSSELIKRHVENVVDITLSLPSDHYLTKSLQDPVTLGFLVGSQEYTVEKVDKVDHKISVNLKHDPKGCHGKKKKFDLQSLSEVLDTYKVKMFDPTIEAKDKFSIDNSPSFDDAILDPTKGDVATALVQREDLGLFSKYLRESPELFKKCETEFERSDLVSDTKKQVIIFAPTNEALTQLEKKPWQFPEDIDNAKSEDEQDIIIQRNILNFVQSHFVETENFSTESDSNAVEFTSINGHKIILENSGSTFRLKLKDTDAWIDVIDTEVLINGAILTIGKVIV